MLYIYTLFGYIQLIVCFKLLKIRTPRPNMTSMFPQGKQFRGAMLQASMLKWPWTFEESDVESIVFKRPSNIDVEWPKIYSHLLMAIKCFQMNLLFFRNRYQSSPSH